jgi:hypothetical protein
VGLTVGGGDGDGDGGGQKRAENCSSSGLGSGGGVTGNEEGGEGASGADKKGTVKGRRLLNVLTAQQRRKRGSAGGVRGGGRMEGRNGKERGGARARHGTARAARHVRTVGRRRAADERRPTRERNGVGQAQMNSDICEFFKWISNEFDLF